MTSWRTFAARTGLAVGLVTAGAFVGARLATAVPGGPTADALTFAGVLRGGDGGPITSPMSGVTLTFVFRKGSAEVCRTAAAPIDVPVGGAFSVRVPIDPARCPRSLFDGDDVSYDVLEGSTVLASAVAVTPVPYARFADQVGVQSDCPAGYTRDLADLPFVVCRRPLSAGAFDEVVKVGMGASAFWVDRFEASVWESADGSGAQLFNGVDSSSSAFPRNGQWRSTGRTPTVRTPPAPPAFAFSRRGATPSTFVSWFQAAEACAASGKSLPSASEWLRAAQGTEDPGDVAWTDGSCRVNAGALGEAARGAGLGQLCRSGWGAQDMIGNVWEWTDEWQSAAGQLSAFASTTGATVDGRRVNDARSAWPAGFNDDGTWNVASVIIRGPMDDDRPALPAAVVRGGYWGDGVRAGVFATALLFGPSASNPGVGFRCVVRR
ncbi:MAG: SUMF1/EgtB/PvdO family nonheme iron enzyme [Polyangiales bacterium]